jgi:tetratricopeptide (TPR) repeat protein
MFRASSWSASVAVVVAVMLAGPGRAGAGWGGEGNDPRRLTLEATSAFQASRYGEAAEKFEAAFALRPDPVPLYNAAQSHRLAGNKPRALELYKNYLQLYPDGTSASDARAHAAALSKAIADAPPGAAQTSPPAGGAPAPTPAPSSTGRPSGPPPSAASGARVPLVSQPAAAGGGESRSLTGKTWFWVALGAAVAVAATTAILLGSGSEKFPEPTFGTARGN